MDLNLSKDHKIIKETVNKVAQKELAPRAAEVDKTHSFVWEGLNKLKEADILGIPLSKEHDGMGMDTLSFILAIEEIAKACASTALAVVSHSICANIILCVGNDKQKKKYLPAMAKGEKSGISIGWIKATTPKTKVEATITDTIKSPRNIQL